MIHMKKLFFLFATAMLFAGCSGPKEVKEYNQGINIIPTPVELTRQEGSFTLRKSTHFTANDKEAQKVARFFAEKLKASTGYELQLADGADNAISLTLTKGMEPEAYTLDVTPNAVCIQASTASGLFYGMQTFLQLLPAEVESASLVKTVDWTAPCVSVKDAPRFHWRGFMADAGRHFQTVENVKKQIDVLASFKINTMHWHLTEDQGWRIEVKKYPRLTEVGAYRTEGDGTRYGGFYTQEQVKDIVAYAAERFITIVPEIEVPGHEMAAIAAYPNLACKGDTLSPRVVWAIEDWVMCPGKEDMFTMLEDIFAEIAPLFPGEYFHIGGDECPKDRWKECPQCQARIRKEGLTATKEHTAEERLQSYVIGRVEKMLNKLGKKIIGWDEILEGGLSEGAAVMSWRGEQGGITAASMKHEVVITSSRNGLYLDYYQGDPKVEPLAIGGYSDLKKVYDYDPVPAVLTEGGYDKFVKGVQCNIWAEYIYTDEYREYLMYPRLLALSEIAWSPLDRKDYADFERRINNAYVRLDGHGINYHIPLPEQPGGSCNHIAFTDSARLEFTTTRPVAMVYTTDGSEPTPASTAYTEPLTFKESTTLKIASVLPSGKMGTVRTITVEKQDYAPATAPEGARAGEYTMKYAYGYFLNMDEFAKATQFEEKTITSFKEMSRLNPYNRSMRNEKYFGATAEGYIDIAEDGIYRISSTNEEVWIDGKKVIDNRGLPKKNVHTDTMLALAKGLHSIKTTFLSHIIGGWPSAWCDSNVIVSAVAK